jgi:hypothetical protein
MSAIKELVGKKMEKDVTFMGVKVKISKLSVAEVMQIQEAAKNLEKDESEGLNLLKHVIKSAVQGAEELDDTDFEKFPMDELSKLSNEIMTFSGIGAQQGK